jgi:hypothetical protein
MCNESQPASLANSDPAWHVILADAYPGYRFVRFEAGSRWRWSAVALHPGAHPWCVITRDPREFARHLPGINPA